MCRSRWHCLSAICGSAKYILTSPDSSVTKNNWVSLSSLFLFWPDFVVMLSLSTYQIISLDYKSDKLTSIGFSKVLNILNSFENKSQRSSFHLYLLVCKVSPYYQPVYFLLLFIKDIRCFKKKILSRLTIRKVIFKVESFRHLQSQFPVSSEA